MVAKPLRECCWGGELSSSSKIINGSKTVPPWTTIIETSSSSKIIDGSKTVPPWTTIIETSSSSKIIDGSKTAFSKHLCKV